MYDANGNEVANHEDINDEGQTVKIVKASSYTIKNAGYANKSTTGESATMICITWGLQ